MTWSSVDWTATEAVVGRIQDRIFRAAQIKRPRLEPDDEQSSCPVLRGLGSGNGARLPDEHLVGAREHHGIDLDGPARPDQSWQKQEGAFQATDFVVDWERRRVRCPEGHESTIWSEYRD